MTESSKAFPLADEKLNKKLLETIQTAEQYKQIKRGTNEVTKALNRGQAEIVIMAEDTDPIEIVLHLPLLSEDKNVPYVFVPSKQALGRASGTTRATIATAILKSDNDNLKNIITDLKKRIEKLMI